MAYLVWQGQEEVIEADGGGRNSLILVAITRSQPQGVMNIDAHLSRGAGSIGVERSGKSDHSERRGPHKMLPRSMISSNPGDDIAGEREKEGRFDEATSYMKNSLHFKRLRQIRECPIASPTVMSGNDLAWCCETPGCFAPPKWSKPCKSPRVCCAPADSGDSKDNRGLR